MRALFAILIAGSVFEAVPAAQAQAPAAPPVTISLGARHAHATPARTGFTHTGGGNIDVAQPAPDSLVITLTGVAVAGGHPCKESVASVLFELDQCFEIAISAAKVKRARLTLEGRVIGLLRSHGKGGGSAEQGAATIAVTGGPVLALPSHSVAGGENLSINCREGPIGASLAPGKYTLTAKWSLAASHPRSLPFCKSSSAELAPDPALDPLWISAFEPFRGASKKEFGLQVIVKVAPEEEPGRGASQVNK